MPSDTPEGSTPREALDRIAALDAEDIIRERSLAEGAQWLYAVQVAEVTLSVVRAVLAEVSPEPGGATSDDHQRGYAQGYTEGRAAGWDERGEPGGVLDRDQARAVQLDRREPREAAAAIAAQILGRQRTGPLSDEDLGRYVADSVLAAVVHLDRDQARDVLRRRFGTRVIDEGALLDALAGCVRPAAIDRDALEALIEQDSERESWSTEAFADRILALVRPVAGVVLSPGEVRTAAQAIRQLRGSSFSGDPNLLVALRALAARLEAGS